MFTIKRILLSLAAMSGVLMLGGCLFIHKD